MATAHFSKRGSRSALLSGALLPVLALSAASFAAAQPPAQPAAAAPADQAAAPADQVAQPAERAAAPAERAAQPAGQPAEGAAAPAERAAIPAGPGEPAEIHLEMTRFAPGVVRVVPPEPVAEETFTGPLTLTEFLDSYPEIEWTDSEFPEGRPFFDARTRTLVEMARQVILRREIYCFEFSFKPLRQIYLDVPQPDGRMSRKLIWYMVYRVRYRGGDLRPAADDVANAPVYSRIEQVHRDSRRFFPLMVLANQATGKEYLDRILPAVKDRIAVREQITAPLHNTVEITSIPIPHTSDPEAPGIWGLVTWEDVDPEIDFFSVYVYGLTNAFKRVEGEDGSQTLQKKVLQLNFYRPGDTYRPTEDTVRFGVPAYQDQKDQKYILEQYGLDKRLDYQWTFR